MAKLTPLMIKKKKMEQALALKNLEEAQQNTDESDDDPQDLEIDDDEIEENDENDNSEDSVETPTVKTPAKKGKKMAGKAKTPPTTPQSQAAKKRPAEDVVETSPKKIRVTFECDDEILKAQHERLFKIAGEKYARGIDKLRLFVKWLPYKITEEELKEAFPTCAEVKKLKADKAYVIFATEEEAKEEFDGALDKVIGGKKVAVFYADTYEEFKRGKQNKNGKGGKRGRAPKKNTA